MKAPFLKIAMYCLMSISMVGVLSNIAHASTTNSPLGFWKTYDTSSTNPRSIIRITSKGDQYIGRIVKNFPSKAHHEKICHACKDENHNQPLIGMKVLWCRKQQYLEGHPCFVYDIDNGEQYYTLMHVSRLGNLLMVHPYYGVPLFGLTLHWKRYVGKV